MPTVANLVAAAKRLSPEELTQLLREIERLEKLSRAIIISRQGVTYLLVRLNDAEYGELHRRSLAIKEDFLFEIGFFDSLRQRGEYLDFARLYATLRELTGESSRLLDPYKGAFAFPFALDVIKGNREWPYLFNVRNYKGSLEFAVRKVVAEDDPRLKDHLIHPPFDEEFSRDEMNALVGRFYLHLLGRWEEVRDRPPRPFVREVKSNLILFGCCGGRYFEEEYDDEEECETARHRYEEQVRKEASRGEESDPCILC
jgi:hypothetical protein